MSSDAIKRIDTGIKGLNKMLKGGIPESSVVLITGGAGCGKTTIASQFLYYGLKEGSNSLYITLEEKPEEIKKDAIQFGWDFSKYEKEGTFRIVYYDPFELGEIIQRMTDLIVVNKIKRIVIDSISLFGLYLDNSYKIRKELYKLVEALKQTGCTSILLSEIPENSKTLSRYGVEEFVADGVIVLYYMGLGNGAFRNLEVRKMRRTDHMKGSFPMTITKTGIKVDAEEGMF